MRWLCAVLHAQDRRRGYGRNFLYRHRVSTARRKNLPLYRLRKSCKKVADCLVLSVDEPKAFSWLPDSCAYRRLANGQELPVWHPLLTGDPDSVHEAGISVRGKAVSENEASEYTVLRQMSDASE